MYYHDPYPGCQRSSRSLASRIIETKVMLVIKRPLVQAGLSVSIQSCCRLYIKIWPRGFDWTIEKPFLKRAAMVCCVSKISSYSWCQWMWGLYLLLPEGYVSHCSWLTFAASLLNSIVPKEKTPLHLGTWPLVLDHFNYSLYFNNHFLEKEHMQNLSCSVNTVTYHNPTWVIV